MDTGIWAIWYDVAKENRAAYFEWFHGVHIPDKLARPGYRWAAHYEMGHGGRGRGYLALFGGDSTHTFLNPGPAQLAARQSAETRHHMAMRQPLGWGIFAQEVRVDGPDAGTRAPEGTTAPVVQIGNFNAPNPALEDDLGSFYAQERFPLLAKLPGVVATRKLLASAGAFKHAVLYEFSSLELREQHYEALEAQSRDPHTWMGRVVPQLNHAPYSPAVGKRISPGC